VTGSNISFTPCGAMLLLATIGIVVSLWLEKKLDFFLFYSVKLKERPKTGKYAQSWETTKK
jgi:hypothetical protein